MQPFYERGGVAVYQGDCHELLGEIAEDSAEAVVTDIPYNVVNRPIGKMDSYRSLDKGEADSAPINIPLLVEHFARIAPTAYVWCSTEQVSELRSLFVKARMTTRQGVWIKTNASPLNAERLWLSGLELCVFARRVNATFNRFCEMPAWRGPAEKVAGFPCPKPRWLMSEAIDASSSVGGLVVDPFCGSGTTDVSCAGMGRKFVGIEKNPAYCEIAAKRIDAAISAREAEAA